MAAERVLNALERGAMISITSRRTSAERRSIAEFVTGKSLSAPSPLTPMPSAMCPASTTSSGTTTWIGWGQNLSGTRFQSTPGLKADDVSKLKLKWAFAFPTDITAYGHPTIWGGRLFTGSATGIVYSLDARTGCIHWYYQAEAGVRAAFSFTRIITAAGPVDAAFFGDLGAIMYAVEAATGKLIWKTEVDDFPLARVTGSPDSA